jgi:hypothetical protein
LGTTIEEGELASTGPWKSRHICAIGRLSLSHPERDWASFDEWTQVVDAVQAQGARPLRLRL